MQKKKLVLLVSDSSSTRAVFNALEKEFHVEKVILESQVPRLTFLKRRIKKLGLTCVIGQIFFQVCIVPFLNKTSQDRIRDLNTQYGVDDSEVDPSKIIEVESVNSEQTATILKELNPNVVVVNGTRIISDRILKLIPAKFVNMHAGVTPLYRGVHGGYWSLVDGNLDACGVTVHMVDSGIDTGNILGQALISPQAQDNFVTYPILQLAAGLPVMVAVVNGLLEGDVAIQACPEGESRLCTHPTIWEYLFYRIARGIK
jgi:folate-dependent phosphoribosylglycinamide formyltransferase PurN